MKHIATFETYAGEKGSQNYPKRMRKLQFAKEMEAKGKNYGGMFAKPGEREEVDYDIIRAVTGWYKNPFDQMWRYEISDAQLRFHVLFPMNVTRCLTYHERTYANGFSVPLGQFLDTNSTSLLKDYPELSKWQVCFFELETNVQGSMDPNEKRINFYTHKSNWEDIEDIKLRSNPKYDHELAELEAQPLVDANSDEKMRSVFVHEIQHAIQELEGFATGSNMGNYREKEMGIYDEAEKLEAYYFNRYPRLKKADAACRGLDSQGLSFEEIMEHPVIKEYEQLCMRTGYDVQKKMLRDKYLFGAKKTVTPFHQYQHSAGEIESRDVQQRMNFPKETQYVIYNHITTSSPMKASDPGILGTYPTYKAADEDMKRVAKEQNVNPKDLHITSLISRKEYEPYKLTHFNKGHVNVTKPKPKDEDEY